MALDWFAPDPETDRLARQLDDARLSLALHRVALGVALLLLGIALLSR